MKPPLRRLLFLLALCFCLGFVAIAPAPLQAQIPAACNYTGTFTGVATSNVFDNRVLGCYQWRVGYSSTGFSAVSLQFEYAPDNAGVPGSWTAFTGSTTVTDGSNPSTSITTATIGIHASAAFVRVNLVSKTGTGTIYWRFDGANSALPVASTPRPIVVGYSFGPGNVAGATAYWTVPFNCVIQRWDMTVVPSGSASIDVWKGAGVIPTVSNTITASAIPAIASGTVATNSTLVGWTTTVNAGDVIAFNLKTITSTPAVSLTLSCRPT